MSAGTLLTVNDLACRRGGRILFQGLSFTLSAGDILQVEGSNGAGKTTLLRCLAGLLRPARGDLAWAGERLPQALPVLWAELAWLGHRHGLKGTLSPLENLQWSLPLMGGVFSLPAAGQVLAELGLGQALDQPCSTLSAGQQRRVALARVFLSGKRFWVLDEPLTALDRHIVPQVQARLQAHAAAGGLLLLTAHQALQLGPGHRSCHLSGEADA